MYITCPSCNFQRSIDEKQIPATATVVTCPRCENKFRFRDPESGEYLEGICSDMSIEEQNSLQNAQEELANSASLHKLDLPNQNSEQDEDIKSQEELRQVQAETKSKYGEDREPLDEAEFTKKSEAKQEPIKEQKSDNQKESKLEMMTDDVPWEHPERYGFIGSLFQTLARVMFKAPTFFSTIHSHSSMLRPASFYALLALFQALCLRIWISSLDSVDIMMQHPEMEQVVYQFSTPMLIALSPFIAVFQLIVYASFLYLVIRITNPDKADYNLTLRVIAYAYAPTILSVVPYFGPMIGLVWFVCNIFIGVKYAFNITWQRAFLALSPIFILWLFQLYNSFRHLMG